MISLTLCVVLGYNVVFGKGKILHFGQEAQSIIGAFALWVCVVQFQQSFFVSLVVALLSLGGISLLLAWLSLRLEPDGLGVMSIALHLAVLAVVLNWQSVTRGALGIPKIPRGILPTSIGGYAIVCLCVLAVWVFLLYRLQKGAFGRELVALSEHHWHAQSLGINRTKVHIIAFLIAGGGSLLTSILFPPYQALLSPSDYHFPKMIFFAMCVIAGGPGNLWGVVLSTTCLVTLREGLRFTGLPPHITGPVQLMAFGLILFIAVWLRRDSIFPHERKV